MNILVINPRSDLIKYSYFASDSRVARCSGTRRINADARPVPGMLHDILPPTLTSGSHQSSSIPVALRVPRGGEDFPPAVLADPDVQERLQNITPQAPLDIPRILQVIEAVDTSNLLGPPVLVFETSFFSRLPDREQSYGLPPELCSDLHLRRQGFHGLFHQMAYHEAAGPGGPHHGEGSRRILSICLEPKPEVCAIMNGRPLTVSGGSTPVEGIPGETSCGDIDPSIVLDLAEHRDWGPEKVDQLLSQQSGIKGLTGERKSLHHVLTSEDPACDGAHAVLEYRIQMSCGAGLSAMGDVDGIVFSGRYADAGSSLGPHLTERISSALPHCQQLPWTCYTGSLHRIVADMASVAVK